MNQDERQVNANAPPTDNVVDDEAPVNENPFSDEQAQEDTEELDELQSLRTELEQAQAKVEENWSFYLSARAEVDNIKKRAERDVQNAHKFALDKFSNELLPVVDSLERALETAAPSSEDASKAMHEGIELTLKMFLDVLKKFNVEQLNPVGEPFDPQFHEAMAMQESQDTEPGTVLAAIQKGYVLNGRLVRPAMVVVSKASATKIDEKA